MTDSRAACVGFLIGRVLMILQKYPDAKFVPQASKKRYFYFLGNKKEKKYYRSKIEEYLKPYPKR